MYIKPRPVRCALVSCLGPRNITVKYSKLKSDWIIQTQNYKGEAITYFTSDSLIQKSKDV